MDSLSWIDLDVLMVGEEVVDAELEAEEDTGNEQQQQQQQGSEQGSSGVRNRQQGGEQGSGVRARCLFGSVVEEIEQNQVDEVDFFCSQADRLIKESDPSSPGFPGFYGCHWIEGNIYPFGSPVKKRAAAGASPSGAMVQQAYVGRENMGSTFRLLCKFQHGEEIRTGIGSAFAVSPHRLVTAGHNVRSRQSGVDWTLKEVLALSGEYVPVKKVSSFGFKCEIISEEAVWGSISECPATGVDLAFLSVTEPLPCYLLPCSPTEGMLLSNFGYPGAEAFLRSAIRELRGDDVTGDIWGKYRDAMQSDIRQFAADLGDFGAAEREARKLLLAYFRVALRGMPDGVQACSAGKVEDVTPAFISHTCPCLPGSSGSPICPLQLPGYFVAEHAGGIPTNQNFATSTDNPKFVEAYMRNVIQEIPGPSFSAWSRSFFTIKPFREWIEKHRDQLPANCRAWLQKRPVEASEMQLPEKRPRTEASSPRTPTHSGLAEKV